MEDKKMTVTCEKCGDDYQLTAGVMIERPHDGVPGHQNVVETLLICPHCAHEAHGYFMTQKLARFRTTLQVRQKELYTLKTQRALKQWRKAKTRHQVEFERLQKDLRQLLGKESPTAVLEAQGK